MTIKLCFKCLCEKPLTAFYKHFAMADGHLGKCKECTKFDATEYRNANLEKSRLYDKVRSFLPHRIELRATVTKKYTINFPERKKANTAVRNAIRDGKLQTQPCWVCGLKAVAHHPDYNRPLDVVWLCQPHHKQAHALI